MVRYGAFGFREVGRDSWNPAYAPRRWKGGTPDIVYMQTDPEAVDAILSGAKRSFTGQKAANMQTLSESRRLLKQLSANNTEVRPGDLTYFSPLFNPDTDLALLPEGYQPNPDGTDNDLNDEWTHPDPEAWERVVAAARLE